MYIKIGYFFSRTDFHELLFIISILFILYVIAYYSTLSLRLLIVIAILYRLLFLFSIPILSDDFYRFIWDGILIREGINPFLNIPKYYIEQNSTIDLLDNKLYNKLNSPQYFTVYPPICQFIFWYSTLPLKNIESPILTLMLMRIPFLLAEIFSFYFLYRLLKIYNMPSRYLLLYAINPLIIIELIGNLHFEAIMISFLLASFFFSKKKNHIISALFFALSIVTKLLPLILLPFFIKGQNFRQIIVYFVILLAILFLFFFPFFDITAVENMLSSINLYFDKFEFNASIYYIVRWLGYQFVGYNVIGVVGKILPLIPISYILINTFLKKSIGDNLIVYLFSFSIYFAVASIIHPWYITTLVALSVLSNYRFPIIWSALVFLSYSAYSSEIYTENLWLIALEYILVYGYFITEYFSKNLKKNINFFNL